MKNPYGVIPEVPERDSAKPDPNEPWRYVCPDCEGQIHGDKNTIKRPYRCSRCGSYYPKEELLDKKRGKVIGRVRTSDTRRSETGPTDSHSRRTRGDGRRRVPIPER